MLSTCNCFKQEHIAPEKSIKMNGPFSNIPPNEVNILPYRNMAYLLFAGG